MRQKGAHYNMGILSQYAVKDNSKYYNIPWFRKQYTVLTLPSEPLQATEPHL